MKRYNTPKLTELAVLVRVDVGEHSWVIVEAPTSAGVAEGLAGFRKLYYVLVDGEAERGPITLQAAREDVQRRLATFLRSRGQGADAPPVEASPAPRAADLDELEAPVKLAAVEPIPSLAGPPGHRIRSAVVDCDLCGGEFGGHTLACPRYVPPSRL